MGILLKMPRKYICPQCRECEAHHCYRERALSEEEKLDREAAAEAKENNEAARLWISGIEALKRKIGVRHVYDLSATPFFLRGSGYQEGTLFPWVVSDFSLMDAIECGIVKLPRVPVADNSLAADDPIYRDLWKHIGKDILRTKNPLDLPPKTASSTSLLTCQAKPQKPCCNISIAGIWPSLLPLPPPTHMHTPMPSAVFVSWRTRTSCGLRSTSPGSGGAYSCILRSAPWSSAASMDQRGFPAPPVPARLSSPCTEPCDWPALIQPAVFCLPRFPSPWLANWPVRSRCLLLKPAVSFRESQ